MAGRLHPLRSPLPLVLAMATVAVVVIAVSVVGSPAATAVREQLVTAKRGVVQTTVSGSGSLTPARQMSLDFGTGGTVTAIHVKTGQYVNDGEVLAEIDPSAAEVQVATAQADLQSAQDALTSAETAATVVATATTTPKTRATTAAAAAPTAASGSSGSGSTMTVAAAKAAVASAELALRNADAALEETRLHAPMSGTVASIDGQVGDAVASGSSASSGTGASAGAAGAASASSTSGSSGFIVLAQVRHFKMDVSLTESDIGKVKVGQPATVTVNAAAGEQFAAHVSSIGVLASSSSSGTSTAVSYPVSLTLDQTSSRLKAGMSASADIITAQESGVSVPTQAIQGSAVTVVRNGKQVSQAVQAGTVGDSTTIIESGMRAGEDVVVTSSSATAGAAASGRTTTGGLGAGGRFGGGGLGTALGGGTGGGFRGGAPSPGGGGP